MLQDFSRQNLRGRSFRGQNLSGADFSGADIRGADFTYALLIGANFRGAKAGLQQHFVVILLTISLFLLILLGLVSAYASAFTANAITTGYAFISKGITPLMFGGVVVLVTLIVFFVITFRQGLVVALVASTIAVIVAAYMAAILVRSMNMFSAAAAGAGTVAVTVTGAAAVIVTGTVANATAVVVAGPMAGIEISVLAMVIAGTIGGIVSGTSAVVGAVAGVALSKYLSWQILGGDKKHAFMQVTAIALSTTGGTNFRSADLTDADFTFAILKSTDFRKAILTRTCWHNTKMLDRIRPGTTYLQNSQLRQVLVTGLGQDKNFDRQDLRGVNFSEATLADASFIGADLSGANLRDADLSRAKLVQTQLDETDLTGATLTGACIEDWGITSHTELDGVRCEYVFMRQPTQEDPNPRRKPDNWEEKFEDGDFADFIKPIVDTLDLYHNQGVDPRAIAISFKQLAENHPDAKLRIVGMEVRGENKFLLRAKTAPGANKSQLNGEYFSTYDQFKGLSEQETRLLLLTTNTRLEEKDNQINQLAKFVETALQPPDAYSKTVVGKVENMSHSSNSMSVGGSVGGNLNNVQGDRNRTIQGDDNQAVLGDNNQVTQRDRVGADPETPLTQDDVVKLLAELEALIRGAEIPVEPKEEVIEDLSAAKNATDKQEPNKTRALDRLNSVAETLEKTSKTVDSSQKLWSTAKPIITRIARWLGAAAGSHLLGL